MKTMMKRCGLCAAFAAALLTMAALVIGCVPPQGTPSVYQPPEGMGSVTLNFSKNIARATILPDNTTITDFDHVILTFTAVALGTGVTPAPITRPIANRNLPVTLIPGEYDLEVVAYLTAATTSAAAVWSTDPGTPLDITVGNDTTVSVTLKPYDPATGTASDGTFAWAITNSITTGPLAAGSIMAVTTLGGVTPAGWTDVLLNTPANLANATGVSIPSNYYYVNITLVVGTETRTFRHVLHIYQNMTSTFTYTFTDDYIGVSTIDITPTITYVHPTDNPPILAGAASGTANGTLNGTGTVADPYILSFGATPANTAVEADEITITVTATTGTYNTITGLFKGVVQTPTTGVFTLTGGTTPVAPFNAAGGPHQFSVTGITSDGDAYSDDVFILIVDES